jgi:glycosyltransferase involved in cell wall biosynthesis
MLLSELPLVSIITPSYNSADFLEAAIASVLAQDYPNLEHLIVDGGSTDDTLEILKRYDHKLTWVSEPDEGQADALNKGFQRAQGEIIGWLNADDTYQPTAIQSAAQYLQAHPQVDLVYGNFNFINAEGEIIHSYTTPRFSLEKLLYEAIIPQTSMFFRRHIIDEVGGVNPQLHYVLDWEFTLRIARVYNVKRVEETWGNFRIVEGTKSVQKPEKFWPEIISVLQQTIQEEDPQRFKPWANDALFMAHLLAALEFARAAQLETARLYVERAFSLDPSPEKHPAILASGLFKTASYPWHNAFRLHPESQRALDNLSACLYDTPIKRRVLGYLCLYRALRLIRQGHWAKIHHYLVEARTLLNPQDFFDWRSARMILGAILK